MSGRRRMCAAVAACLVALCAAGAPVAGAAPARVEGLDSALTEPAGPAAQRARGSERVNVWVQPAPGGDAAAAARAVDGTDVVDAGTVVEAQVERARLPELAARTDVAFVRPAVTVEPTTVGTEGLTPTGASAWHTGGVTGAGVPVAIIDAGFAGVVESQQAGELPPTTNLDACEGNFEATAHGTEVAEVVHAMAPGAELTLICAQTLAQTLLALDEVIARGIPIVNFSAGYVGYGPGDGTGGADLPDELPRRARANGVLWVNAAGNSGNKHWSGTFADVPASGPVTRFTIPAGQQRCVRLRWADWPRSAQDYDVRIVDAAGTPVSTGGRNEQTAAEPLIPLEIACATNPGPLPATYGALIERYHASTAPQMDLFAESAVSAGTPARSLIEPAAAPGAFTVGAVCWSGFGLEPYSAQGPTLDGRVKPDLVAPANTSSDLYGAFASCGTSGFTGTSVSAPHVTGAAALLLQARPHLDADGLHAELTSRARDLGTPGLDAAFGAGALQLGPLLPGDHREPRATPAQPATSGTPAGGPGATPTPRTAAGAGAITTTAASRTKRLAGADVITLPQTGRCIRARRLRVRAAAPRGALLKKVEVKRDGHLLTSASGRARTHAETVKGLPRRGTYRVSVTARLDDGRRVTLTRRYRACA